MLQSLEELYGADGMLEGDLACTDRWLERPGPIGGPWRLLRLFLGDPSSGPAAWFFSGPPGDGPDSPAMANSPRHYHRSDSFRIALGADQRQQYHLRGRSHDFGDYRLDPGNVFYADERFGFDGYNVLIFFGDRRGIFPISESLADVDDPRLLIDTLAGFPWGDTLPDVFLRNEQTLKGLATTSRSSVPKAGLNGSFQEDTDWVRLGDGSAFSAGFMADGVTGPAVLLSQNVPGVVEAPSGSYATDMLRIVLKGSVKVGERTYRTGEFVASEAGVVQGEVRHGPQGSWQVLLLADRRGWLPTTAEGFGSEIVPRLAEVGTLLAPFVDPTAALTGTLGPPRGHRAGPAVSSPDV